MTTVDPDRTRTAPVWLRPLLDAAAVAVLLVPPVYAWSRPWRVGDTIGAVIVFLTWVLVVTGIGVLLVALSRRRSAAATLAFVFAGVAGVPHMLVGGGPLPPENVAVDGGVWAVGTAAAVVFLVVWLRELAARRATRVRGVLVRGVVHRAAAAGMTNFVPRQRLTVRFDDAEGTTRYVRAIRVGGGWHAGDAMAVRYDPRHPSRTAGILLGEEAAVGG